MHILIVEDDQVARDYLAKGLRDVGHTVDVAADGIEGLQLASSLPVELAIVDRMLPKLDGLALVQSLRATSESARPCSWRAARLASCSGVISTRSPSRCSGCGRGDGLNGSPQFMQRNARAGFAAQHFGHTRTPAVSCFFFRVSSEYVSAHSRGSSIIPNF